MTWHDMNELDKYWTFKEPTYNRIIGLVGYSDSLGEHHYPAALNILYANNSIRIMPLCFLEM